MEVLKVRMNTIPALVKINLIGTKPLAEPVMVSSMTYICVTRPQWINLSTGVDYMHFLYQQVAVYVFHVVYSIPRILFHSVGIKTKIVHVLICQAVSFHAPL